MKPVIPPTTGRRVLLFVHVAPGSAGVNSPTAPFDAGIAYVWSDNMINVSYADHNGVAHAATSVRLYDRAQNETDKHGNGETYAVWMPYQFEQAKRAAEPKVGAGRPGDIELNKIEDNGVPVGPGQAT